MENLIFQELMKKSIEINKLKAADYAQEGNPYSNFKRAASLSSWFNHEQDKAFVILIGTKLARLAELLNGKKPKNESIDDSFLDLVTYCGLWASYNISMLSSQGMPDLQSVENKQPSLEVSSLKEHTIEQGYNGVDNSVSSLKTYVIALESIVKEQEIKLNGYREKSKRSNKKTRSLKSN